MTHSTQPIDLSRPLAMRDQSGSIATFRWARAASRADLEDLEAAARTLLAVVHCEQNHRARIAGRRMSAIALFFIAWMVSLLIGALAFVALDIWITTRRESMRKEEAK